MNVKKIVGLVAALTLAATIAACGTDAGETAAVDSGDALGESVQVNGDWKIDIVDPDGTVADSVEFRNAFVGQANLSRVLSGEANVERWRIQLNFDGEACPTGNTCLVIAEVERDGDSIVLTGDLAPTSAAVAVSVWADLGVRILDTGELLTEGFSKKSLLAADGGPGEVPVEAGQIVQVEVTYTFG